MSPMSIAATRSVTLRAMVHAISHHGTQNWGVHIRVRLANPNRRIFLDLWSNTLCWIIETEALARPRVLWRRCRV